MPSKTDRTAGEIDWPAHLDRTPPREREQTAKFSVTFHKALADIESELLERVGADDWRVSTAAPQRKSDGMPYADATPDDPGVVARWSKDGQQYAVAADRYTDWRDNARAIGLYIREKRKMSNRPVHTGRDEFATAALPGPDDDAIAVGENGHREPPHEILGVAPDADPEVIEGAARQLKAKHHPDQGGDRERFQAVVNAERALLEENS